MWKGVRYCYIRVTLCIGFFVNHNIIFFPILVPRKCYQGLSRSCQNYCIILAGYITTTTPTAITPLLFALCITSTVIEFLFFFPSPPPPPPPPLPPHFYCFLPPPPPPSSHFYPWDKDVNGVNVFVRRETRFFRKKGGNWCTLYYFTWIPLKLRPWRFFTSSSIRL